MRTLYINGKFLTQAITGVQRYAHEVVGELDNILEADLELRQKLRIIVVAPHRTLVETPEWRHVILKRCGRLPPPVWEQISLPLTVGTSPLFCPGNVAPILSLLINRHVTVTVHDLSYLYFPDAYSRAFRAFYNIVIPMVFKWARHIFTVSNSEKESLKKVFPKYISKIIAIQNGILSKNRSTDVLNKNKKITKNNYALYVGSLSKRKNFDTLIKVAIGLVSNSDLDFVFVGATQSALTSSDYFIPDQLRERIIFTGQINDKPRLTGLYKDARVFVFPSFYEASPLPPSEAMAYGIPVVASDIPSLRERCQDAAIFRSPTDVAGIVEAIKELHQNPELHAMYAARAHAQAAKFAWSAAARAVIEKMTA